MRIHLVFPVLLLSLTLVLPTPTVETATGTTVLDINGRKLQTGTNYYVLPVIRGRGGGLALASRNKACPLYVGQENFEVSNGLPLKFFAVDKSEKVVQESTDVNIVFSAVTICVQSTTWKLGDVDGVSGRSYVTSGGVTGSPGIGTVSNWFKIERYRDDYKLVFCPTVCNFCKVVCGDVGVSYENQKRWLVLSDVPLPIMFKKA